MKDCKTKMVAGDKKENKRLFILATIVMLIFLGFTVVAYVGMETALTYSWDNAGYYRSFIAYARDFNIKNLFDSLDHSNYNPTPVLLPALLGKLFPATRPAVMQLTRRAMLSKPAVTLLRQSVILPKPAATPLRR